jgi:hypothetical protein
MNEGICLYRGLFARSPREYADVIYGGYRNNTITEGRLSHMFTYPSTITNIGLQTRLPLIPVSKAEHLRTEPLVDLSDPENECLALINHWDTYYPRRRYAIHLKRLIVEQPVYVRVRPDIIYLVRDLNGNEPVSDLFIQQIPRLYTPHLSFRLAGFYITLTGPSFSAPFENTLCTPDDGPAVVKADISWYLPRFPCHRTGISGTIIRTSDTGAPVVLAFGMDTDHARPMVCIYSVDRKSDTTTLNMAETKRLALRHGPNNVFHQYKSPDGISRVADGNGLIEEFDMSLSTALSDDKLVCSVIVLSWGRTKPQFR